MEGDESIKKFIPLYYEIEKIGNYWSSISYNQKEYIFNQKNTNFSLTAAFDGPIILSFYDKTVFRELNAPQYGLSCRCIKD